MLVPNRHASIDGYRYGFQGQEKDDEVKGEGNSLNYTFRMHDPRLGRFFAVDPLHKNYPWLGPYSFSGNRVIDSGELEGLEMYFAADGSFLGQSKRGGTEIRIATKYTPYQIMKNGKTIENGSRIIESQKLSQFNLQVQTKIFQTIYDREIGGRAKVIAYHGGSGTSGTGAETPTPLGTKAIKVNMDFRELAFNNETDHYEVGIGNLDYYSAATNLKHEEKHFKGLGDNGGFEHFEVWKQTYQQIRKDGTYNFLNKYYVGYMNNVGAGYLDDMQRNLRNSKGVTDEDFDYGYDMYVQNVKIYNKQTNKNIDATSKDDFLKSRKQNSK